MGFDKYFHFRDTNSNKVIKTLNINKACQNTDIPTKILKLNTNLFAGYSFRNFNYSVEKGKFPCVLHHADVVLHTRKKKEKR